MKMIPNNSSSNSSSAVSIDNAVSIVSNVKSTGEKLEAIKDRARDMYEARAYVHWYEKYGVEEDDFEAAFESVECTVEAYRRM
jgi:uncharacterized protein YodC (DUF2158 family)